VEENVQAIKRWERAILGARSKAEQVSDRIACTAGSGPVLVLHVLWFGAWVTVNSGMVRIRRFDPFPFPFLTMTVSLEAIFLALLSALRLGKPERSLTASRQTQPPRPADRLARGAGDDSRPAVTARHRRPLESKNERHA
jgi:hypothetical protein